MRRSLRIFTSVPYAMYLHGPQLSHVIENSIFDTCQISQVRQPPGKNQTLRLSTKLCKS